MNCFYILFNNIEGINIWTSEDTAEKALRRIADLKRQGADNIMIIAVGDEIMDENEFTERWG